MFFMNLFQYRFYIKVKGQKLTCYLFIGWQHDRFHLIDGVIENLAISKVEFTRELGLNPVLLHLKHPSEMSGFYREGILINYDIRGGTIAFHSDPSTGYSPIQFKTTILTEKAITDDEAQLLLPHRLVVELSGENFVQVSKLYLDC